MTNLEYYLNQLTIHKVDYDKTKLTDWLSDVSYCICEELSVPVCAYKFRIQEEERILSRILFAAKELYETPGYLGINLNETIDNIGVKYLSRRIINGDDFPFKKKTK
jgi:hypothetical protein